MKEPVFKSNLTMKEIESNFEGMDFFGELMEGLTEALAYSKGQAAANTFTRKNSLPDINVSQIRKSLDMTQKGSQPFSAYPLGRLSHGRRGGQSQHPRQRN